mmetsp:Transcript_39353/g.104450  ORF Transcript_39353/g.104450 Transcript_39353/m.104450 type:complete len:122 (+) Transcript_39353:531-896(+)|eukprot:5833028-Prymnesium_polylepis.1
MERLREEADETLEDAYELLVVTSRPAQIPGLGLDDEELLAELDEMEEEEKERERAGKLTEQMLRVDVGPSGHLLPSPPQPSKLQQEEARELAELEALAASMRIETPMPMPMHAMALAVQVA